MAESEFTVTWITAMDAVDLFQPLYTDAESARQVLVSYAGSGLIRSRCLRLTAKKSGPHEPIAYTNDNMDLSNNFWEAYADTQRRLFADWATGHFAASRFVNKEWWQYRVFGVHFVEEDIRAIPKIAPKQTPPGDPPYRAKRPEPSKRADYVSPGELKDWFESYVGVAGNFRAGNVQAAASAHFAPRLVSRDPIRALIRDFGKTEKRGKPASSKSRT